MYFNSFVYVFAFLPLVFAAYLLLRETRFANLLLAIASFVFYAWLAVWYLVPMLISAVLDYFVGLRLHASDNAAGRRRLLILSVVVNLSLLAFFKYTGWLTSEFSQLASMVGISVGAITVALPPGISFYTFQTMSYTIDVYRGKFRPRRNFIDYVSFVTFFPQLVAGPIERATHLLPQLEKVRPRVSNDVIASSMFMILFGLFQKTVLADNLGSIVEFVERNITKDGHLRPGLGVVYLYAFAFQIYCDFAAYSNIARGTGRLFGIDLMRNFLTPYFAPSPSEFWRRWHISLSTWLRDYLYIPLGGNRAGKLLTMRNLIITMALGGLWHGAGVLFIVWGLYHGVLLVLYALVPIDAYLARLGKIGRFLSTVIFFHLVCIGWLFFRSTPETIGPIWASILSTPDIVSNAFVSFQPYFGKVEPWTLAGKMLQGMTTQNWNLFVTVVILAELALPVLLTDYLGFRKDGEFADRWNDMGLLTRLVSIVILIYAIVIYGANEANEFIYFAF